MYLAHDYKKIFIFFLLLSFKEIINLKNITYYFNNIKNFIPLVLTNSAPVAQLG